MIQTIAIGTSAIRTAAAEAAEIDDVGMRSGGDSGADGLAVPGFHQGLSEL
jgi:hypothetical protein